MEESFLQKLKRLYLNGGDELPAIGINSKVPGTDTSTGDLVTRQMLQMNPGLGMLAAGANQLAKREGKELQDEYDLAKAAEAQLGDKKPASLPADPMGMAESLAARSGDDMRQPVQGPSEAEKRAFLDRTVGPVAMEPSSGPLQTIDFGDGGINNVDNLRAAQEAANMNTLTANMLRAGDAAGAAISGTKPKAQEAVDSLLKQANAPVEQFKALSEQEKNDPDSPISKGYREAMKRFGIEVKGNASAAALEKVAPWMEKVYNADQARKQRAFDAEQNRLLRASLSAERASEREHSRDLKKQDKKETFTKDFRKEITGGALKTQYQNFQNGRRALSFINDAIKNPNGFKDYGSLMASLKALQGDDSVVREAEIRLGASVGSVIDKVGSYAKQITSGQKLTENQRKLMFDAVKTLADISKRQYEDAIKPVREQAKDLGIDEKNLLMSYDIPETSIERKPASTGTVKIRRKTDGVIKAVDPTSAKRFLTDPNYEQVQ